MKYSLIDQLGNILRTIDWHEDTPPDTPIDETVQWVIIRDTPQPSLTDFQIASQGAAVFAEGIWSQSWEIRDLTAEEIEARKPTVQNYIDAVQDHLDAAAKAKNYDSIVSACSYAGAPNPFQAEGATFVTWRGDVWAKCYAIMGDVQSVARTAPTIAELLAELPGLAL